MDILLVGIIAGAAYGGWRTGLLRRLVGLGLLVLAFVLGAYLRGPMGQLATGFFKNIPADYAELVGYSIAFALILAVGNVIAHFALKGRAMSGMSRRTDQLLGALFGVVETVLILSAVVVILDTYFGTNTASGHTPGLEFFTQFRKSFNASQTVHLLRQTTVPLVETVLGPLLPKDISSLLPHGLPKGLPLPKP